MEKSFEDEEDVIFLHLQTVFEGIETNTPARGAKEAKRQGIAVPTGHDARIDGSRVSLFMQRYGTGGTPWTTVIDRRGVVRLNSFTPEQAELRRTISSLVAEPAPQKTGQRAQPKDSGLND